MRTRILVVSSALLLVAAGVAWALNAKSDDGTVRWIVHYPGTQFEGAIEPYLDLVKEAPANVRVVAIVQRSEDAKRLRAEIGPDSRHEIIQVTGSLSPWARDRYVLFQRDGHPHCLALPDEDVPELLRGDVHVPDALRAAHPDLTIVRTPHVPQGGDVIVTQRGVIVGMRSLASSAKRTGQPVHAVVRELERLFGRPLIAVGRLGESPLPPHVDVYIANAGGGRLLVADPRMLLPKRPTLDLQGLGRFTRNHNLALVDMLDDVAAQLAGAGFEVHRIPGLFADRADQGQLTPTALTYANVIREGNTVYMPIYGEPSLDRGGRAAWERLGFKVVSIRARAPVVNGGAVRCMTNRFPGETDI